jgi:nitroreductase
MAYSNMVFQAISLGLSIHPMGGFERDLAIRLLEIPENYEPVIFAALGYRSANTDFSEKLVEKEKAVKPRKPIQEIAFHGYFGNKNNDL